VEGGGSFTYVGIGLSILKLVLNRADNWKIHSFKSLSLCSWVNDDDDDEDDDDDDDDAVMTAK
jgi:hypothetical protein